jgi:hypothetical protein
MVIRAINIVTNPAYLATRVEVS